MLNLMIALTTLAVTTSAFAYSTLDCNSTQNLSYSSHNKVGGARPYQGMITHIEEIKKDNEVIFRKVRREECRDVNLCQIQQPEIVDINAENIAFNFIESSKITLSLEGPDGSPLQKETYAIKFVMENEIWMLCDSFTALYP
jgi:hypothetical protein